jgi:DNA-binding response OmpR family regulator
MPLVLLVEDEETLRKVLRSLLERDGFEVAEAADGAEALSAVDRLSPDAIVLDLNLPVLDGYDVLSRLRTRSTSATLPVLVLTANGDEASEVRALKMGANEFLTKPFRPRALGARLKLLLSHDGDG